MKAKVGSLLFIEDRNDATKRRPYMCIHIFKNKGGVPYDWLIVPITSIDTVGSDNLVEVAHKKLSCMSYAKINNIESISWSEKIEVSRTTFEEQYVRDVTNKLGNIFKTE